MIHKCKNCGKEYYGKNEFCSDGLMIVSPSGCIYTFCSFECSNDWLDNHQKDIQEQDWLKWVLIIGGSILMIAGLLILNKKYNWVDSNKLKKILDNTTKVNDIKTGGYFGELKYIIRDGIQNGALAVHHMPSYKAITDAGLLDRGSGSAIIMEKIDHEKTASYGYSLNSIKYQNIQKELLMKGKFDEAFQMDINDLRNIFDPICGNLYNKYEQAINEVKQYINILKTNKRL
ncbi:hypothetical protein AGMMS4952_00840 [Spirochaetia bacterium]|nr:hypothetical protein AGMMS4952_00840 [Spirochaetia bacterium]